MPKRKRPKTLEDPYNKASQGLMQLITEIYELDTTNPKYREHLRAIKQRERRIMERLLKAVRRT